LGVAQVDGFDFPGVQETPEALHQVIDVAETAGLPSVSENGQVLSPEGLPHEGREGAAVVESHPCAVSVEYPGDPRIEAVVTVICHGHRFREAFRLIVDTPRPDGVDVSPVIFGLGVNKRISVTLRRGGKQKLRSLRLSQAQGLVGPERPHLQCLDRQPEVVDRARRRGEMQDVVDPALHVYILGHVVLDKRKPLVSEEMGDIVHVARDQVVHADDVMSFFDKKSQRWLPRKPAPPVISVRSTPGARRRSSLPLVVLTRSVISGHLAHAERGPDLSSALYVSETG